MELTLYDPLMVGVVPDTVNLTQAFAEPWMQLVADVLFVPSLRVEIVSVPGMIYLSAEASNGSYAGI
jgi:hypothetical protein